MLIQFEHVCRLNVCVAVRAVCVLAVLDRSGMLAVLLECVNEFLSFVVVGFELGLIDHLVRRLARQLLKVHQLHVSDALLDLIQL